MSTQEHINNGRYKEAVSDGLKVINSVSAMIKKETKFLYPFFEGRNGIFFSLCYNIIFAYIKLGNIKKANLLKNTVIQYTDKKDYLDSLFIT